MFDTLIWLWLLPAIVVGIAMAFPPRSRRSTAVTGAIVHLVWSVCMFAIIGICLWILGHAAFEWLVLNNGK